MLSKEAFEFTLLAWKYEVYDKGTQIDPNNEKDWADMAYGYLLARQCSPEQAEEGIILLISKGWL